MGEVYRAKDPRLGREVAIKVLPASFSADADRLRRFEQEAKAAGVLNHPNITAVHDVGQHEGAPYVVQELLEGETLRAVLAGGRLSGRRAIEYAVQIVHGLAAAHEKGIVHRDLKPENLFVTRDGRVKILDFGLAKLTLREAEGQTTSLPTATAGTEPGVVMGTLGYMSPEQVRGKPTDGRSDIFSFGSILYEMVSGRRAFSGDTAADTMSAILREDPPDLSVTNQNVPPGLERIVRHCMEKDPERRFQSTRDLAFDLESLSTASGAAPATSAKARAPKRLLAVLAAAAAGLLLLAGAYWLGRQRTARPAATSADEGVTRRRLTFRRGNVLFARFTADAQNVVYGASWGGRPTEVYISRVGSPETRPLGIPGASLLAVSSTGELAILLKKENLYGAAGTGTLARVPIEGGAPRQVAEDVMAADWAPDGKSLAVLRLAGGKAVVEYPLGKRIAEIAAASASFRVSPNGRQVALIETDGAKSWIDVIDVDGRSRKIAEDFAFVDDIAWSPSGREIWFDGMNKDFNLGIYAGALDGTTRTIAKSLDLEIVHDVAKDGTVLIEREIDGTEVFGASQGGPERNLTWLDSSQVGSLSADGKALLFSEIREGGGDNGSAYLRPTDGGPAVRLGDGRGQDLSPDGKWALTVVPSKEGARVVLVPTGAGEPRTVPIPGVSVFGGKFVSPDGKRLGIGGTEPGHGFRLYLVDLAGGKPRAVTPEVIDGAAISPDGRFVAATAADHRAMIYPVDGSEARAVPGLGPDDVPIQWSADGDSIFAIHYGLAPLPVYRVNLKTGKKEPWRELMPADRTGFVRVNNVTMTRDGLSYAYSIDVVTASDLFLVKGWK